ncbi:hypothetical protein E2C01_055652 [Portunus trituberculatus]|uniref:Uncharacterized protein n=1 Tax=Portunus trituberculatus TaxID=210409 RepID=A0A5B7GVL3_PORTR|nr:hypothetical protein [Portunus trituberculatus]
MGCPTHLEATHRCSGAPTHATHITPLLSSSIVTLRIVKLSLHRTSFIFITKSYVEVLSSVNPQATFPTRESRFPSMSIPETRSCHPSLPWLVSSYFYSATNEKRKMEGRFGNLRTTTTTTTTTTPLRRSIP